MDICAPLSTAIFSVSPEFKKLADEDAQVVNVEWLAEEGNCPGPLGSTT
jgi:hypothetical protein